MDLLPIREQSCRFPQELLIQLLAGTLTAVHCGWVRRTIIMPSMRRLEVLPLAQTDYVAAAGILTRQTVQYRLSRVG